MRFVFTVVPTSRSSGNIFVYSAGSLDSNLSHVKSNTELPTARLRCDISLKGAVLPGHNDAEINHTNSLQLCRNAASRMNNLICLYF